MGKPGKINGIRAEVLRHLMPVLMAIDQDPEPRRQKANDKRKHFYESAGRVLVLCFGYEDPLANDEPGDYFMCAYSDIPAARDMPKLPPEESKKRNSMIVEMTEVREKHQTGGCQRI